MHPRFIIPALLLTTTQAAPNSYLEKAKSIFARSNLCLSWIGGACEIPYSPKEAYDELASTPTQNYRQDEILMTAPQPVPATAPEIAFERKESYNLGQPAQPVPILLQQKDDSNHNRDNSNESNGASDPKAKATCQDFSENCTLCRTDEDGKRVCESAQKGRNGQVCSKTKDSQGKPICAVPAV